MTDQWWTYILAGGAGAVASDLGRWFTNRRHKPPFSWKCLEPGCSGFQCSAYSSTEVLALAKAHSPTHIGRYKNHGIPRNN